jgi:hypothetical protein
MNTATKLGSYSLVLVVALAGGAGLGKAFGPEPGTSAPSHHADDPPTHDTGTLPGLAIADQGYRLEPERTVLSAGTEGFRFRITGPDGAVVTSFADKHGKELHLIAVSRDLGRYQHVHPSRDSSGTWSVPLTELAPGPYRVFADFQAVGGPSLTLGVDVTVPGDHQPAPPAAARASSTVDGFSVRLSGDITPDGESTVVVEASRDGRPAPLEPYLGADGHLVAIRDGDLAYLHVHPESDDEQPGTVAFALHAPSAGRYRLFFDFQVDGVVRTADFTVDVAPSTSGHDGPSDEHGH